MSAFRRDLWLSGLAGLLAAGLLAALSAWLVAGEIVRPPLPNPLVTAAAALALGGLSLAEVPLMVAALRHMAAGPPGNRRLVMIVNAAFVFFAAVYGAPVLLVTGSIGVGLALCALAVLRLAAGLLFVRESRTVRP